MKKALNNDPVLKPEFKARMLRERVDMAERSLNDWVNLLRIDNICMKNNPHFIDFRYRDFTRINAWLSDYTLFTRGEM